ncbi:unnamed protein product [Urochloa decumbens]|uniref:Uncharacterized protein n=1 Tax=Urochloa decumbens TaxID=240449 RepID=A0ABC9DCK2_9POAL
MSDLELISYITEENERRKKRRIVLTELYFESVVLGLAYLSEQRPPRNIGSFSSDEQLHNYRKYLLKEMYHGSEVTCYDKLRLTKRNFHDLCALLRERCGARTGAESAQVLAEELEEATPDIPQKRQRTGEAILSMLGDMRTSFQDALKANEPLSMPQATPPAQILATLEEIPDLARSDLLWSYGKLILSERLVQALMELPMDMRKEWLLMLN